MLAPMSDVPDMPLGAEVVRTKAALAMRYEDVCQDGRLMTMGMPQALGTVWRESVQSMPVWNARNVGIIPILAQMWMRGTDERVHVGRPAHCEGEALLAHTKDEEGGVARIVLDMRARIYATRGSVLGAQPEGAGETVLAGEVFARHVFTKLFAAPGDRRVRKLEIPGVPAIPSCEVSWIASPSQPDEDALEWLDPEPQNAVYQPLFAPHHCDSNQHVNSLVYPRMFEDAAHVRFDELGVKHAVLSREVALSFRRPFFSGQRSSLALRAFRQDESLGVSGQFLGAEGKGHCDVLMRFR
tara:strand:- start:28239 stop:29132 length:894 start_codon:yes stop_codon:yes gene_type:complete